MPEIQKNQVNSREMAQRFVQFVMVQSQNVLYLLGKIPTPDGYGMPPNLEAAKMLIDQLEMIEFKTHGNLSSEESHVLQNALTNLRLAFVEASGGTPPSMMPSASMPEASMPSFEEKPPSKPLAPPPSHEEAKAKTPADEDKKKFFKSYG